MRPENLRGGGERGSTGGAAARGRRVRAGSANATMSGQAVRKTMNVSTLACCNTFMLE